MRRGSLTINAAQAFVTAGASAKRPSSLLEGPKAGIVRESEAATPDSQPGTSAAISTAHKLSLRRQKLTETGTADGTEMQPFGAP